MRSYRTSPSTNSSETYVARLTSFLHKFKSGGGRDGDGIDDAGEFLRFLSQVEACLDVIETERDHEGILDPLGAHRHIHDAGEQLKRLVEEMVIACARVITRWMLPCDVHEFITNIATVSASSQRDMYFDFHDEISIARGQVAAWRLIARTHQLFARRLRVVMTAPPRNELQIQRCAEMLFIGNGIPYVREREVTTCTLERRRPDFLIPAVNMAIELKLCSSPVRLRRIPGELRDDTSFADDFRLIYVVIYDCGQIADPLKFAADIERAFQTPSKRSNARRAVSVEIVKQ